MSEVSGSSSGDTSGALTQAMTFEEMNGMANFQAAKASAQSGNAGGANQDYTAQLQILSEELQQMVEEMENGGGQSGGSTPVGNTGLSLTGDVSKDMQTLQQLVNGVGTNGSILQQYAQAVSKEAQQQGNGLDSSVAGDIGGSLSDGTYDQQGSSNAISSALQGQSVDPLQNNLTAIIDQMKGGESGQSIANNLNALAKQASAGGNDSLAAMASAMAGQAASGTLNDNGAAALLQQQAGGQSGFGQPVNGGAGNQDYTAQLEMLSEQLQQLVEKMENGGGQSDGSTPVGNTGLSLTGDVSKDMQTLQQLVNGVGTNGSILQQYAQAVSKEAQQQGNGLDSAAAGDIGGSLSDGTYDQQGSSNAISSALQGQRIDPLQNNLNVIINQIKGGESGQSIANNLNALSKEASEIGNNGLAATASAMADQAANGTLNAGVAEQVLASA